MSGGPKLKQELDGLYRATELEEFERHHAKIKTLVFATIRDERVRRTSSIPTIYALSSCDDQVNVLNAAIKNAHAVCSVVKTVDDAALFAATRMDAVAESLRDRISEMLQGAASFQQVATPTRGW